MASSAPNIRAIKGMNDILPDEVGRWQRLESAFRSTVERHGYGELRTPLLEPTELFVRSVGETTDIVQKEMFTLDHHGDSLTLRPEGTASAARAYVEHTVGAREPVTRWYYLGPMFRAERPQRGRYRCSPTGPGRSNGAMSGSPRRCSRPRSPPATATVARGELRPRGSPPAKR